MHHRSLRRGLAALLSVGVLLLLAACSGSGGGRSGGDSPTDPGPLIVVISDAADAPRLVYRLNPTSSGTRVILDVVAEGVVGLASLDFLVVVPTDLLSLVQVAPGPFLQPVDLTVSGAGGALLILQRTAPGAVDGTGVVATLTFDALASGVGRLEIGSLQAFGADDLEIPGIAAVGAEIRITL
ncbi:MAG: hypothetical protein AAGN46_10995 [Acidobacteriota bacterium]